MIVRPGTNEIVPGQLIALAAAVGFAISVTMVKSLTRTDSVLTILFWMLVIQSVIGLIPALDVWRWPSAYAWAWIVAIAFCGTFSHYCLTRAMLHADATVVVPSMIRTLAIASLMLLPLTALAGWLLYNERLDMLTILGAALILSGNLLNLKGTGVRRS